MAARLRPLLLLAALLLVTQQFWLFPGGDLPSPSRDMKSELLPALMAREQLAQGEFPWSSPWFSREPNLQIAPWSLLYPGMMLMVALPTPLNVRLYLLLHILIGFGCMYLLLRCLVCRRAVAEWGALVYVFSGHWAARLTCYQYELVAALAWLPLAAYAYHRLCSPTPGRPSWRPALLLALVMTGLVYAGAMYALVFAVLSLAAASATLVVCRRAGWRELRWLGAAAALTVLLAAPKLVPSLLVAGRQRPPFQALTAGAMLAGLILPGEAWWAPGRGLWDPWDWAGISSYVSLSGVILAGYGVRDLLQTERRAWGMASLAACAVLVYWGLGFPPFGMPYPLSGLRTGSRVLLVLSGMVVLLAALGLDALLGGRQCVPRGVMALALAGLAGDVGYALVRGWPAVARALGATERQLVYLYAFPWNVWRGWALAGAGCLAAMWAWRRRGAASRGAASSAPTRRARRMRSRAIHSAFLSVNHCGAVAGSDPTGGAGRGDAAGSPHAPAARRAQVLAAMALFSVMAAMAGHTLESESDPLREGSLLELREDIAGSVVGLAGFDGRDVQDRVLFVLAGHVHLLNPAYSSLGQDVSAEWLERIEYVVSGQRIEGDLALPRTWYPFDTLMTLPAERLSYAGTYQTEDPYSREDLAGTKKVADLPTATSSASVWLYRVR